MISDPSHLKWNIDKDYVVEVGMIYVDTNYNIFEYVSYTIFWNVIN